MHPIKKKLRSKTVIILSFFLLFSNSFIYAQKGFSDPDKFLIKENAVAKILLVGSWHFNYPGLDAHKAKEENKINIYSEQRQKELKKLIAYISRFKPTKIAVESGPITGYLINNFKNSKTGKEKLYANERSQIGMQLVEKFNLDTIYGVDAYPLLLELTDKKDTTLPQTYIDEIRKRHYFGGDDEISKRYTEFYNYRESMTVKRTLLENFKYINSDKAIDRMFGSSIAGGQFESKKFEGPDALSMHWMNRNLRIFKKIKDIPHDANDRILVIFGAGHIPILKWLFQTSPQFELVKFNDL